MIGEKIVKLLERKAPAARDSGKAQQGQKYSTQDWLEIKEIKGPVVTFRSGQLAGVVAVQPISFDFLGIRDQDQILERYQGFLDSLNFEIQIITVVHRISLAERFQALDRFVRTAPPALRAIALQERLWEEKLVKQRNMLSRRHYVVVWSFPTGRGGRGSEKVLGDRLAAVVAGLESIGLKAVILQGSEVVPAVRDILNAA